MTAFLPHYFELLKHAVLKTADIKNITPHGCRILAAQIFTVTRNSVSETTLKRIYGFAQTKFKPSVFTINILAQFCGFPGWEDFCIAQENIPVKDERRLTGSWESLKINTEKITNFTLQVLRNKSGIPYSQTIKRDFITRHLNAFEESDYRATVISAPAYYGKTIGLCHWIEEKNRKNITEQNNDIILLFSAGAVMNAYLSGHDLNQWLLELLGYTSNETISEIFSKHKKQHSKFFLVIDAFDEYAYKARHFKLLLNQLLDVLAFYQSTPWFKLIITMRSSTWINNRSQFEHMTDLWFTNFKDNNLSAINTPLFNFNEIRELAAKINPALNHDLLPEMVLHFRHPLFFQIFYKKHRDNFSFSYANQTCLYELVSAFVLNKIYMGQYAEEKIQFLTALVEKMDFSKQQYDVARSKVASAIKQYQKAYNELLSIGFICEINKSTSLNYSTTIQFTNSFFLEYTIAKVLLRKNNDMFNKQLINRLNILFVKGSTKLPLLKWYIIYAIKTGQQNSFDLLTMVQLSFAEKADLVSFLGDLLSRECTITGNSESLALYFKQDCSRALFNYFFALELIDTNYKKTLYTLLQFNLNKRKRVLIYTALAMSAIVRLDISELEDSYHKLKSMPPEAYSSFAINPLSCISAVYTYLTTGTIKKSAFIELLRFYNNPPKEGNYFEDLPSNDFVFLLATGTLLLYKKPAVTLRFIELLERYYKKPELSSKHSYAYFINIIIADCYYQTGKTNAHLNIYTKFSEIYTPDTNSFTSYMKTMFYLLKIKNNMLLKRYKYLMEDTRSLMEIAGELHLCKLALLGHILSSDEIAGKYPSFYKQCRADLNYIKQKSTLTGAAFVLQPRPVTAKRNN
ncbi:hypothetical protein CKK33_18060 [Mucilaginibacter sp. MD40]|uniref:hypothetical protein n=1 Tax=Mucilaginibacter sp. MD40 TaxID=2029590 RepID=UPI000BACDEE6|nr:hypothetical protein [Mucilaginibacter sp. MD40]PAW95302.1 hypothetical protein CKK33_18060 [Mucilaginibacter sp. MD40]